jgi:hypothetical protein
MRALAKLLSVAEKACEERKKDMKGPRLLQRLSFPAYPSLGSRFIAEVEGARSLNFNYTAFMTANKSRQRANE